MRISNANNIFQVTKHAKCSQKFLKETKKNFFWLTLLLRFLLIYLISNQINQLCCCGNLFKESRSEPRA